MCSDSYKHTLIIGHNRVAEGWWSPCLVFRLLFFVCVCAAMRKKGDLATPWHNGSMNDKISLRDCIMRDKIEKEQEAERICDVTEAVQCKHTLAVTWVILRRQNKNLPFVCHRMVPWLTPIYT